MKTIFSLILSSLFFAPSAYCGCIYKEQIALQKKPVSLDACQRIQPKLKSDSGNLQWWEGGFTRRVQLQVEYFTTITNYCTRKTLLNQSTFSTEFVQADFPIRNTNLEPHEHSYEDLPLAAEEVRTEMNRLRNECQNYSLESAQTEFGQ